MNQALVLFRATEQLLWGPRLLIGWDQCRVIYLLSWGRAPPSPLRQTKAEALRSSARLPGRSIIRTIKMLLSAGF